MTNNYDGISIDRMIWRFGRRWQIELAVVRPRPEEFFAIWQTTY
jgi:hypothetical protein